jgi:hypothetical protein
MRATVFQHKLKTLKGDGLMDRFFSVRHFLSILWLGAVLSVLLFGKVANANDLHLISQFSYIHGTIVAGGKDSHHVLVQVNKIPWVTGGHPELGLPMVMEGEVQSLKPGNSRVAVCIRTAEGTNFFGKLTGNSNAKHFPKKGCLGQIHDAQGAAGMPVSRLKPQERVVVILNDDMRLIGKD